MPRTTARLTHDLSIRPSRIRQLFLTGPHPEAASGLYSILFRCRDADCRPGITGPASIEPIFMRSSFYAMFNFPVCTSSYRDENISAAAIPLRTSVLLSFELPGLPGKFLPGNAKALGVAPGPLFGRLAGGEPVTLPDGRIVSSADCTEPPIPPEKLLLVDCPTEDDIAALPGDLTG
jgi:ribonuclease Z